MVSLPPLYVVRREVMFSPVCVSSGGVPRSFPRSSLLVYPSPRFFSGDWSQVLSRRGYRSPSFFPRSLVLGPSLGQGYPRMEYPQPWQDGVPSVPDRILPPGQDKTGIPALPGQDGVYPWDKTAERALATQRYASCIDAGGLSCSFRCLFCQRDTLTAPIEFFHDMRFCHLSQHSIANLNLHHLYKVMLYWL